MILILNMNLRNLQLLQNKTLLTKLRKKLKIIHIQIRRKKINQNKSIIVIKLIKMKTIMKTLKITR